MSVAMKRPPVEGVALSMKRAISWETLRAKVRQSAIAGTGRKVFVAPATTSSTTNSRKMIYSLFFTISQRMQNLNVQHLGHVLGSSSGKPHMRFLSDIDERALLTVSTMVRSLILSSPLLSLTTVTTNAVHWLVLAFEPHIVCDRVKCINKVG